MGLMMRRSGRKSCLQLHVSNLDSSVVNKTEAALRCLGARRRTAFNAALPLLSSGSRCSPFFFLSFHHMKREGKSPPGHFSSRPLHLPTPALLLPIRSRESISNKTMRIHPHVGFLLTPASPTQTLILPGLHFKHMKGCSVGTKAKGKARGGGMANGGGGKGV